MNELTGKLIPKIQHWALLNGGLPLTPL